jgi:hypothetical protein
MKKTNDSKLDIVISINNNTNIVDNLIQEVDDFKIIINGQTAALNASINLISGEIRRNIPTNFDIEKFKYSISNEVVNFTVN